ncbi:MAG: DUF3048 domain-containing protein [Acidimicrobiales bacterium]|nr:DUF3048 domain-containing protein [Acidimicrobiales bacterium]
MNAIRRIAAVVVALTLLASACSGGENTASVDSSTTTSTTSTTTTSTTTTLPEAVASTEEETTTTTIEEVYDGPVFPLTGEPLGDAEIENQPAMVIKISNNDARSRASLTGLDQADVIFEERIEANATRFAAVFHSAIPDIIGPVRSARTTDIDIVGNLSNPLFGYSGSNEGVARQIREADRTGVLTRVTAETGASPFFRDTNYSAPDNLMVDGADMLEYTPDDAVAPSPVFSYADNVVDLGEPSFGVRATARSNGTYVWSADDAAYMRFQGDEPHMTREDVPIMPENVIIMTTTYVASRIDRTSVDAITVGSGDVQVFSNGYAVEGTWTREFARDPITLETPDGQEIGLAPGQTWVVLAPVGTSVLIGALEVERLLG